MRSFHLDQYSAALDKQVVHMDQGVCYCPEFRATRAMRDYPSRKLQLARCVYRGELAATSSIGRTLLHSILSRQGERWQNFGESPEELTDCMLLCREMMLAKGLYDDLVEELYSTLHRQDGHILDTAATAEVWSSEFARLFAKTDSTGGTALFLDDAVCTYGVESAGSFARFLKAQGVEIYHPVTPFFDGWEYFVYGKIDDGIKHARKLITDLENAGIHTVITLSARSDYVLSRLFPKIGVNHSLRVINILDIANELRVDTPTYLYAGSFQARYMFNSQKVNSLIPNPQETVLPGSEELTPILDAPYRVNTVNIWQKPVCAEHLLLGFPSESRDAILQDALRDIESVPHRQIAVLDPWAYRTLVEARPSAPVVFYPELL